MRTTAIASIAVLLACITVPTFAEARASSDSDRGQTWLAVLAAANAKDAATDKPPPGEAPGEGGPPEGKAERKAVPLPFHCIEGYSGGAITPLAYLCNYCNCGCGRKHLVGPTVSYSFMGISTKTLSTFVVTQPICNRVEFGYALNHLRLGSLYDDIRKMGLNPGRREVYLHHFNIRANLLPENSFNLPLPAVSAGVHFKYNYGLKQINRKVGKAFSAIGLDKHYGVDYTVTMSKMFPTLAIGRPVILTGGIRFSKAAQLGLFGFGDTYRASFEGSVVCLPTDFLVLGYEFRQKRNPYGQIPGLVGDEDNWQALSASWIVNKHLTVSGLAGLCGHVGNANADTTWGLQVKWEF